MWCYDVTGSPRCFRNLNTIMNTKEREDMLISRLHECGRQWEGEYPTEAEVGSVKRELCCICVLLYEYTPICLSFNLRINLLIISLISLISLIFVDSACEGGDAGKEG